MHRPRTATPRPGHLTSMEPARWYEMFECAALVIVETGEWPAIQFQELEELAKTRFLVTPQMPWFSEHTLDHARGLVPLSVDAGSHELFARPGARTMRRDDRCDDRREFVNDLHDLPSRATAPLQPRIHQHHIWFPSIAAAERLVDNPGSTAVRFDANTSSRSRVSCVANLCT